MPHTMITAHSGCEGTPDNSLESIERGAALGADCVEVDVRLDPAGRLILSHDHPEDGAEPVPLERAFSVLLGTNAGINCDLKESAALVPVLELAEALRFPRERLFFSGAVEIAALRRDPELARRGRILLNSEVLVRSLAPELPDDRAAQQAFLSEQTDAATELIRSLGAEGLNAPYRYMPKILIAALRERGVRLSLWTVNEEAALRDLLAEGLFNLTTRTVRTALRLREESR